MQRTRPVLSLVSLLAAVACGAPEQAKDPVNLNLLKSDPALATPQAPDEYKKGEQALLAGDFGSAKAAFEAALVKQPDRAEAHSYLGAALEQLGDKAGAEAHYQQALVNKHDLLHALSNLSALYLDAGRFTDCAALLDRPELQKVAAPELEFNLGLARAGTKDLKGAEAALRAAIGHSPTQVNYRVALAQVLGEAGRGTDAVAELRQARDLAKSDVAALRLIGASFREQRAATECITTFDAVIAAKDESVSRVERGLCKFANKDNAGAKDDLQKALTLDTNQALAHYWLGVIAMVEKNKALAEERLGAYLKLEPKGSKAKEAEARLKTLSGKPQ